MDNIERMDKIDLGDERDFDITDAILHRKDDVGRLLLRLAIGGLMLFHGMNKLLYGNEEVNQLLMDVGAPAFFSFGVFLGEVIGPILLLLGFKARVGAFFIVIDMVIAILLVHSSQLTQVNQMGGWMIELNALYLLGAIAILFLGSGRYALTKGRGALD
jgi:putative oxidoreductase